MKRIVLLVALALVVAACTPANPPPTSTTSTSVDATTTSSTTTTTSTTTTPPTSGAFVETFDGDPATPTSRMNALPGWFAQPIMQGTGGWDLAPEPMDAQHDLNCGPPPATHRVSTYAETVYQCKNHLMTAINPPDGGTSSGVVTLKPDHMVDLSRGEATIKVDVSTLSPSRGDWWEIWIMPPTDALLAPSDHWLHQAGPPRRGVLFQVVDGSTTKHWYGKVFNNYAFAGGTQNWWEGADIRPLVSLSDTRRDTYELRLTKTSVTMLVEESSTGEMVEVDSFAIPPGVLGDRAVVQFAQQNYAPEQGGNIGCPSYPCPFFTHPATWHWDNAVIDPAIPTTLIGARPWQVWSGSASKAVTFDAPAPAGSDLMFVSQSKGNAPQVSFDGGVSWTTATAVRPPNDPPNAGWGGVADLLTYRVPVPVGATGAEVRGVDIDPNGSIGARWVAQNFHIVERP